MNLNGQIRKLDKDLNVCKEKLNTLFKHTKLAEEKPKSKNVMDKYRYRKNYHEDCVPELKKDARGRKPLPRKMVVSHDALKRPRTLDEHILTQVQLKGMVKPRSRSVCSARERDVSPPYCKHEQVELPVPKPSWARILRDHHRRSSDDECPNCERPHCSVKERFIPLQPTIQVRNRGVQCSENGPSSGSVGCQSASTNFLSAKSIPTFSPYNPARTLQFLVFEFKENLRNKSGDNKLLSIVNDMEDIVSRLKFDPDSCLSSVDPKPDPKADYEDLRIKLTDKYQRLESTSKSLEILCTKLKEEKKLLSLELDAKRDALKSCEIKENEYLNQVSMLNNHIQSLNQRSEQQSQSMQELTKVLNKLQADSKTFENLREQHGILVAKLGVADHEIDRLQTECQFLKLEKERANILLDIKSKQLHRIREDLKNVGGYAKKEMRSVHERVASGESSADQTEILCSSPNESGHSGRGAGVFASWRRVSDISIQPDEQNFVSGAHDCPSATPFCSGQRASKLQPSDNMRLLKQEIKNMCFGLKETRNSLGASRPCANSFSSDDEGSVQWEPLGSEKSPETVKSPASSVSVQ